MEETTARLEAVTEFTRLLRKEGLSIGSAEQQAAVELLNTIGMEDRTVVRDALQAVLAKSRREQETFTRVFDSYFVSAEQKKANAKAMSDAEEEMARRRAEMEEDLTFNGKQIPLREDMREAYLAMPEEKKEELRKRMRRYKESAERHPNLYDNFIQSIFLRTVMEQQLMAEDAGIGNSDDPDADLLYREISSFGDADLNRAVAMLQRVAGQINGELSAKRKKGGHSGQLDFRATIRKGLETGGALTRLRFRKKREHRRRLILLCDVSGSMMQFSEFVLRFMKALNDTADRTQIFLFSEELRRVDPFALQNMDNFRSYVRHSGCFGKGTDLGKALRDLRSVRPGLFTPSTVFLVLTDAKTVDINGALESLVRIDRMTGRTVVLCPIPKGKWQYLNGCRTFSEAVDMLPCSTIDELASACRKLF